MTSALVVEMLPAKHGDALVVSYGTPRKYRMVIDAGPRSSWRQVRQRLDESIAGRRIIDLLVITHVDTDHIEGVLKLLQDESFGVEIGDIWFNDYDHLMSDRVPERGGVQGAYLGALLNTRPWNEAWGGASVRLYDDGAPPEFRVDGDPASERFTVLSPTEGKARRMAKAWKSECAKKHLPIGDVDKILAALEDDGRYRDDGDESARPLGRDGSAPNGSSIAFLFEVGGKAALFTGDAHASVLVDSLRRVCKARRVRRLRVDAFKLSHHGSRGNITEELLALVDCDTFLVSTNGDIFGHPDAQTIDLIASSAAPGRPPTIWFNYECASTERYRDRADITAKYGQDGYAIVEL
jgi:hypothetical protein